MKPELALLFTFDNTVNQLCWMLLRLLSMALVTLGLAGGFFCLFFGYDLGVAVLFNKNLRLFF